MTDEQGIVWRRGCGFEEESCEACKKADGSVISDPDEDLSTICQSPRGCFCISYSDLTEGNQSEGKDGRQHDS